MFSHQTVDKPGDVSVSEDLFQDTDATIECGCCYDDCRFEDMVQCSDGHLFCRKCVENYTRESVFGQGKVRSGHIRALFQQTWAITLCLLWLPCPRKRSATFSEGLNRRQLHCKRNLSLIESF